MRFKVFEERCVGCQLCQLACSVEKYNTLRIKPSRIEILFGRSDYREKIVVCRQCKRCECVEACTYGAFKKDKETGGVYIDYEECQSCLACIDACPLGAVSLDHKREFPMVCDLCGGDPPCVEACCSGALTVA